MGQSRPFVINAKCHGKCVGRSCYPKATRTVGFVMHDSPRQSYRVMELLEEHRKKNDYYCDYKQKDQQDSQHHWKQFQLSRRGRNVTMNQIGVFHEGLSKTQDKCCDCGENEYKTFTSTLNTCAASVDQEAMTTMENICEFEAMLKHQDRCTPVFYEDMQDNSASFGHAATDEDLQWNVSASKIGKLKAWKLHSQRTVVRLLPRLFANFLLKHNSVVSRLQELGKEVVLKRLRTEGTLLGMQTVGEKELYFLLSCIFDEKTLWKDDVKYLFCFFDWSGKGTISFEDLLAGARLLFAPAEMQAAVHCKRVLGEWALDDSVISVADVNVMLTALTDIFGKFLSEVPALCDKVRTAVENVMPMHTVPLATFRAEMVRFSVLKRCVDATQWDGSVLWSQLLPTTEFDDSCDTPLERKMKFVRAAIAAGREPVVCSVNEKKDECCMDVCHPRFMADVYILREETTPS